MLDKEYRPWMNGYYMVSSDGYIYVTESKNGGVAGRFLLPRFSCRQSRYMVRVRGRGLRFGIPAILREVWDIKRPFTERDIAEMRVEVEATNRETLSDLADVFTARRDKAVQTKKEQAEAESGFVLLCPFAGGTMDYFPPEVKSWDDARMDPMTSRMEAGVWVSIQDIKERAA